VGINFATPYIRKVKLNKLDTITAPQEPNYYQAMAILGESRDS
jgi:hypothetical protein